MKRIAFVVVLLGTAVWLAYGRYPEEFGQYAGASEAAANRMWANIEANPVPVFIALGTFLLTIVYHKLKGKSLRESLEFAATRVTVVPVKSPEEEAPAVRRAKARATRTQLLADQIGLENRARKLPDAVQKAEKETCYTEQAVADAERALAARKQAHEEAVARLEAVRKEKAVHDAELAEIAAELKKLADVA